MGCCAKPYQSVENKIIDKLLRSKHYIGRDIRTTDPDIYFKNKAICEIIDKLRYGEHNEKLIHRIKSILKKQKIKIDGGDAESIYPCYQHLDLGKAGSTVAELDYKCYPHKKINGGSAMDIYTRENILDLGKASSDTAEIQIDEDIEKEVDCGYAKQEKCLRQIDLGGAQAKIYGEYILDSTVCDSGKAILQIGKNLGYNLDGGSSLRVIREKIDLGCARNMEYTFVEEIPANIQKYNDAIIQRDYSKPAKLKSEEFSGAFLSGGKARTCGKYIDLGGSA